MPIDNDDGKIRDDAGLLRRIHPGQIIPDANLGRPRPSSGAFKALDMSVDAEPILELNGMDWHFSLNGRPGYSLVRFFARVARESGLTVVSNPEPHNPAHTLVKGKKTQKIAETLRNASSWVHLEHKS